MPSKAEREAARQLEQEQANLKNADFLAALPLTVFDLMVRASKRSDVTFRPYHDGQVRRVEFKFDGQYDGEFYARNFVICLETNFSWQLQDAVNAVINELDEREAADAEAASLRKIAQETYDGLSPVQRKALELHQRP
jgi:hypothetical protein